MDIIRVDKSMPTLCRSHMEPYQGSMPSKAIIISDFLLEFHSER